MDSFFGFDYRPTEHLRFVRRPVHGCYDIGNEVLVLQQLWVSDWVDMPEKWLDVPVEEEDA